MICTNNILRRGLRVEVESASLAMPEIEPAHRSAWTRSEAGFEAELGGGKLRCSVIDVGSGWTDYRIEVVEDMQLRSIACEWHLLASAAERVRVGDLEIARGTPVTHESEAEALDFASHLVRRSAADLPEGWGACFEITSLRTDAWCVRSVIRPELPHNADLGQRMAFRRHARVSTELAPSEGELTSLAAGTTLRIGLELS